MLGSAHFILGPAELAARPSGVGGRTTEARIAVEATPRTQADEELAYGTLQSLLELDGVVSGVKDEQGDAPRAIVHSGSYEQPLELSTGDLLVRMDASHIHGGSPTLADEAELGDELVGPPRHDGLPGGVAGGMIIVVALGAGLRIGPGPYAHVHGIYGMLVLACGEWISVEQLPRGLGVDPPPVQRGVKAAPATTMRCCEAQADGRGDGVRGEESLGEFKEGVGPRWMHL